MSYSETAQQVSAEALIAEAKANTQQVSAALIAEAKAITANFRLNRDGRELNKRLLALGIALTAGHSLAESETEKRLLALGFITVVISDGREFEKNLLALGRAILTNF